MSTRRAVLFGYGYFGVAGYQAVRRVGWDIALVVTHSDRSTDITWWDSLEQLARADGVPVLVDVDLKDRGFAKVLSAADPEVVFSMYYRHMIPTRLFRDLPLGGWNLHGSLLPRYRGRSPANWILVNGEREGGITIHRMVKDADAGDILHQQAVAIHPDQDALGLTRQLLAIAPQFLDQALGGLWDGTAKPWVQDATQATVVGGRCPEDGRIDWSWSARRIHNLVRAVAPPWPGAFVDLADGRRLSIRRTAVVVEDGVCAAPGTVLPDGAIACGHGAIALLAAGFGGTAYDTPFLPTPGMRLAP
jgi:UDP-4-amino-4-deoxy-L-arabinose formyltransferase / UDP-glucuronic acid dehydrogenase (UDP-4-keto-hexauronic acid decarboxylating)